MVGAEGDFGDVGPKGQRGDRGLPGDYLNILIGWKTLFLSVCLFFLHVSLSRPLSFEQLTLSGDDVFSKLDEYPCFHDSSPWLWTVRKNIQNLFRAIFYDAVWIST